MCDRCMLWMCREAVKSMVLPAVLRKELSVQMEAAGIPLPESEARWQQAERAIIGVWASKFNDRAYFSMRKVGLNFMDLRMAVLVQRVVPAEYAFVIHTVNPSSGARSFSNFCKEKTAFWAFCSCMTVAL
jgi:alpha-glucan, water dikinase